MKESERNKRKSAKIFKFWYLKLLILFKKRGFVVLTFQKARGTPSIFDVGYMDIFCPCNDKSLIDQQGCFDCLH